MELKVAVVGATSQVGREILKTMAERDFPAAEVVALAAGRGSGQEVSYGEERVLRVRGTESFDFADTDLVFMAAGEAASAAEVPRIAATGAMVIDLSGRFLGRPIALPVMLAPVGGLENFHPEGGAPAARACGAAGVPIMVSSVSLPGLEGMAAATQGPKVFQLYVRGDRPWVDEIARSAIAEGYDAFCLTVDTAIYSRRERDIAKRFVKPWRERATGQHFQAALNWDDVKRFKDTHAIPLALKGIATAEDAAMAVEHGVEVVYVSNHGGRQLDHGRGALDVLPEVVKAVDGKAKVWVDGGFSRGTDIVKAVAMGAELVGLGRLYCYALAAAGEAGVARMFDILKLSLIHI